jgi:hypothetical protein
MRKKLKKIIVIAARGAIIGHHHKIRKIYHTSNEEERL